MRSWDWKSTCRHCAPSSSEIFRWNDKATAL
jgi:predicted Fe-S protein YdhL (DUF1289 family)